MIRHPQFHILYYLCSGRTSIGAERSFDTNASEGVTWVHSYVVPSRTKSYCIYDGPTPESIRTAARRTGLPVDSITEVSVPDPYFYRA